MWEWSGEPRLHHSLSLLWSSVSRPIVEHPVPLLSSLFVFLRSTPGLPELAGSDSSTKLSGRRRLTSVNRSAQPSQPVANNPDAQTKHVQCFGRYNWQPESRLIMMAAIRIILFILLYYCLIETLMQWSGLHRSPMAGSARL